MNSDTMRHAMQALNQRPIVIYPVYIEITGSIEAALLLSQACYWASTKDGGAFWKTDEDFREECHLSIRQFRAAKSALRKLPFITVAVKGVPAKTWYTVDFVGLSEYIASRTAAPVGVQSSFNDGVQTGSNDGVQTSPNDGVQTITESTPEMTPESTPEKKDSAQAREVFEYWQRVAGHPRTKLDEKRKRKIRARLRDGYTVDELRSAVDGVLKSPFHMGENDHNMKYDDIELICRDAAHVDRFMRLADQPDLSAFSKNGRQNVTAAQRWLQRHGQ